MVKVCRYLGQLQAVVIVGALRGPIFIQNPSNSIIFVLNFKHCDGNFKLFRNEVFHCCDVITHQFLNVLQVVFILFANRLFISTSTSRSRSS